jgi:hypothetical protein
MHIGIIKEKKRNMTRAVSHGEASPGVFVLYTHVLPGKD